MIYHHHIDTYERQLQLLCGVCMLDDKLAKSLPYTMTPTLFGNLVVLVVGQIVFVLDLSVGAQSLSRTSNFG